MGKLYNCHGPISLCILWIKLLFFSKTPQIVTGIRVPQNWRRQRKEKTEDRLHHSVPALHPAHLHITEHEPRPERGSLGFHTTALAGAEHNSTGQ